MKENELRTLGRDYFNESFQVKESKAKMMVTVFNIHSNIFDLLF